MADLEVLKKQAALKAVACVESGMVLGLGTGSTAKHAIDDIGRKLSAGELRNIVGVATSKASEAQARRLGIPLKELGEDGVDLAIDGMDEITPELDAIKGLGGALTREKIVEARARMLILIADDSKRVTHLGQKAPVPIEVVPFGYEAAVAELRSLCSRLVQRQQPESKAPFITDNHNYIFDAFFDAPFDAVQVASQIKAVVGVVEHGLFLNMASCVFLASAQDGVQEMRRA